MSQKKSPQSSPFTHDSTTSSNLKEVPTITSLLNRKKYPGKAQGAQPQEIVELPALDLIEEKPTSVTFATLTSRPNIAPTQMTPPLPPPMPPKRVQTPQILKAKLKAPVNQLPPFNETDSLTRVLEEIGPYIKGALYLNLQLKPGSNLPTFIATAQYGQGNPLWNKVLLHPKLISSLWNAMLKTCYVQLNQDRPAAYVRKGLGCLDEDVAYICCVGPITSCRGLLVLVSDSELEESVLKRFAEL